MLRVHHRIKGMNHLLLIALVSAIIVVFIAVQGGPAYAHYFGATLNVDNYQIVFSPYPSTPKAGDNSTTLNFSVLDNKNNNLNNIYSALVITEKQSGKIVEQVPYQRFEFSDISIQYTFPKPGDYVATLQTRIQDDPKYEANPLIASFNISALDPNMIIPFDELMLFYVTPAAVVISCLAIYLHSKNKV
jgi:hypothetical protein